MAQELKLESGGTVEVVKIPAGGFRIIVDDSDYSTGVVLTPAEAQAFGKMYSAAVSARRRKRRG